MAASLSVRKKNAAKKRRADKPSAVERQVQSLFGLTPGLKRGNILPFAVNPATGKPELGAPQFVYDMARAFAAPGIAASGQPIDAESEATNLALNFTGTGGVASRMGRGAVGEGRAVLGMSGAPKFEPPSKAPVVSQAGRMGVPVVGREQMAVQHPSRFGSYATIKPRRPEAEVAITRKPTVVMPEMEVFNPERLQNARIVPLYGDKSIAGNEITSINDMPVSVETFGGPRYAAMNAAAGSPSGWASELPQINALRNQVRGGLEQGQDVYGVYTAMSPRAADQTTMMADALLQQMQQAPVRARDIKDFDAAARQIIPSFAGVTHPEAFQQLLKAKQGQRKSLVELMDSAKALEAGFPDVSATRIALTEPQLMQAPGGASGFQVVKFGPESLEPVNVTLPHPTYGTQMAGTPVGGFENMVPFDMLYPDLIKERRALDLSSGRDLRSFEFRKPTQTIDQETLDRLMKYLEDIRGAE